MPLPKPRPALAPGGTHGAAGPAASDADTPGATAGSKVGSKGGTGEPEPGEAGAEPTAAEGAGKPDEAKDAGAKSAAAGPPPSPCRLALTEAIAVAPSIAPIRGPGACGGDDLVRLEAVVLADGRRAPLKPAAILRCPMASAVADWVRTDMTALAARLGSAISEVDNFDSFECRGRNRVAGAKLSEHGRANALDVRGLRLASGRFIALTDRTEPREVREEVLHAVCGRFATVLGPGSDWYHEDHIHLDLAERRGGYRICQWNVYDPLPAVAPLLPAERPAEAPPREEVAEAPREAGARQKADSHASPQAGAGATGSQPPHSGQVEPDGAEAAQDAAPDAGTTEPDAPAATSPAAASKKSAKPKPARKPRRMSPPPS